MLDQYIGIALMMVLAAFFASFTILLSHLLGPKRETKEKLAPYECGVLTIGPTHETIPIKYYIVAMLFLVFDLEVVYLYPWATAFKIVGAIGFIEMLVFIFVLLLGLIYVWKKGALEWE